MSGMNLPKGKTCADCAFLPRCEMLGVIRCEPSESKDCDWSPSRFADCDLVIQPCHNGVPDETGFNEL